MLTPRENFLETIRGGHPDRFVDQYEYIELFLDPIHAGCGGFCDRGGKRLNDWGVTVFWPEHEPGPFPVQDEAHLVLKDVTQWEKILKPIRPDPDKKYTDEQWKEALVPINAVDRKQKFVAPFGVTGIFERLHYFLGVEGAMIALYEEPEAMHDLIDFITEWEIDAAKVEIDRYHPDACFKHDDWGSQTRLLLSPDMFREFLLEPYKKLYGFWKSHGAEVIVHHNDAYGAELVPSMIEMGIDVFQGATYENNIPALLKKYGGQISIQAGLDNGKYDKPDWSREKIHNGLAELFEKTGGKYIIPCFTMGGPGTTFEGAYEAASAEIAEFSKIYFPQK